MQDVHGVDHKTDIRGVLAFGVRRFLMRDQPEFRDLVGPFSKRWIGPVAKNAAQRRLAQ